MRITAENTTLFISDLHLDPNRPDITETFFHFLSDIAIHADALYILGDLFEVYIGDDDRSPFMESVVHALAKFTETGPPTYLMHGNRDFLIRKKFIKRAGVIFIRDPSVIEIYGQEILLMHGDSLCTLDIKHQKSRRWARNWWVQSAVLLLPLKKRQKVAAKIRAKSSARNQKHVANKIMDVAQSAVIKEMKMHNVTRLIHGHTHKAAIHELEIDAQKAERIVLDSWHHHGNYLRYNHNGQCELINLPFV